MDDVVRISIGDIIEVTISVRREKIPVYMPPDIISEFLDRFVRECEVFADREAALLRGDDR